MKFPALFLVALTVATCARSQDIFEVLNSPTTNSFVTSSFISDNEGWLADYTGVLWHTTDAGQSWIMVSTGKTFLKLNFTDTQNGFATGEAGEVYRTSDAGVTWEVLPLSNAGLALWFFDAKTGIIAGDGVLYKTTDGGESWTTVLISTPSFSDFYFADELNGIATTNYDDEYKSIWRTSDGGLTWSPVYSEPRYYMHSVWFLDEETGFAAGCYEQPGLGFLPAINKSTDGGFTWVNIYKDDGIVNTGESLIDIRFADEMNGFAIGSYGESVFTTDGGVTWTPARTSAATGLPKLSGIFKSLDGYSTIYISGDNGYVIKW